MTTSINIDGQVVRRPGVYTIPDVSQAEATGQSAGGIVALLGTCEGGGTPVSASLKPKDFLSLLDGAQARTKIRSGDLREAAVMAFSPANDEEIAGGAQRVVCMKVNQALPSSYTFNKGDVPAITVTSTEYGAFTEQISIMQQDGTNAGTRQITTTLEALVEDVDNIGGVEFVDMIYREDGTGWDNVRIQVLDSGIRANATRREAGLVGDAYDMNTAGAVVSVVSSAADTRTVTIYGTDTDDEPQTETLTLNGTNTVLGTKTWNRVYGAKVSGLLAGATVTVREGTVRTIATSAASVTSNVLTVVVAAAHRASAGSLATTALLGSGFNVATPTAISAVGGTSIAIPLTHVDGVDGDGVGTVSFYPDVLTIINNTDGLRKGGRIGSAMYVARDTLVLRANDTSTGTVLLFGKNHLGAAASEFVTLTGVTPVETATRWSEITFIALENVAADRFLHISGVAAETLNTVQNTLQKAADYFNARQVSSGDPDAPNGFDFTILSSNPDFLVSDLDLTQTAVPTTNADVTLVLPSGVDIKTASATLLADLFAVLSYYDAASTLTTAERIEFDPKIVTVIITALNSHAYAWEIDGVSLTATADGSATIPEVQTLLANTTNRDHRVNRRVVCAAFGSTGVTFTAESPPGFDFTTGDSNLVPTTTQASSGAGVVPDNTASPVFLIGGEEGAADDTAWQQAFDRLKLIRVNTIVPLSGDPAHHAMLKEHLVWRASAAGRTEADGVVGLEALDVNDAPTGALPDKTSIKEQIINLNTRHIGAVAQTITRFNSASPRELTEFRPCFFAAEIAGMQAGSRTGTPLTEKGVNADDIDQHSSWDPLIDVNEMLQLGLLFALKTDDVGIRIVRNLSTYIKTDNLIYQERSMNASLNEVCFELRRRVSRVVGKVRNKRWVPAAVSEVSKYLSSVSDPETGLIEGFDPKTIKIRRENDSIPIDVTVFFPPPINFVPITVRAAILND